MRAFLFLFSLTVLLCSCRQDKVNIVCYDLRKTGFIEKIRATGTVQAVNTITIVAPRVIYDMTVRYLEDDGKYVQKGDTICILDNPQLIDRVEMFLPEMESLNAEIKKLEADNAMNLSVLQAQIETNEVNVKLNSLDSVQKKFAPPVKQKLFELELQKANVEKMKLRKKFAAQKTISDAELRSMKSRIMVMENMLQRYRDQVSSLVIVAPKSGIVMHVEGPLIRGCSTRGTVTIGGKIELNSSIWSDMQVLQIPDTSRMQVTLEVPETDYKRIETGQKVLIHVDAVKDLETTGVVKRKTLVGKTRESQSAVKSYEIIVAMDSCHSLMKPGLSAGCEIIVKEVRDTIVVPTLAVFERDSAKVIYVARDKKFIPVVVETGSSNSSESIVVKGLSGNETIALMEPPHKLIVQGKNMGRDTTGVKTKTSPQTHGQSGE